jgi:20S proteasome alpha/beta subunit
MTLIIGIKCEEGAVMAADGAATFGDSLGTTTIRQDIKKLRILKNSMIIGTSGSVGLAQRFAGELDECYEKKELSGKRPFEAMTIIKQRFDRQVQIEQTAAQRTIPFIGAGAATNAWMAHTIVAIPISKDICLFEFTSCGSPEEKLIDTPFVSIGSGQSTADPFLAFQRRLFWPIGLPDFGTAIFSALWTIQHAIETSPGGIADPIQVAILSSENGQITARELNQSDLGEHFIAIAEVEEAMATQATSLSADIPVGPTPPN